MPSLLTFAIILTVLSFTFNTFRAQDRAPHGLAHENPMAFSPSAYNFFHPDTQTPSIRNPCEESNCSPLPLAATVQSSLAQESRAGSEKSGSRVGAGGIAGIIFGFVFLVLLGMGVYYVVTTRQANSSQKTTVLPSV